MVEVEKKNIIRGLGSSCLKFEPPWQGKGGVLKNCVKAPQSATDPLKTPAEFSVGRKPVGCNKSQKLRAWIHSSQPLL